MSENRSRLSAIRRAAAGDAGRLAEIEVFNYRLSFYPIFRDDGFYFNALTVERLSARYAAHPEWTENTLVYDDGAVKGFVRLDGPEIAKLFVEPVLQGRGIGTALLERAVALGARRLWALEKIAGALRFYARHGFVPTGERRLEEETEEYLIGLERAT